MVAVLHDVVHTHRGLVCTFVRTHRGTQTFAARYTKYELTRRRGYCFCTAQSQRNSFARRLRFRATSDKVSASMIIEKRDASARRVVFT